MKTISRDSRVYKIAQYGGLRCRSSITDVCSLFWRFVWGLVRAPFWGLFFGIIASFMLGALVVIPLVEMLVWAQTGWLVPYDQESIWPFAAFIWGFFIVIGGMGWAHETWKQRQRHREYNPNTLGRLIKSRWSDWRSKTCSIVEIK